MRIYANPSIIIFGIFWENRSFLTKPVILDRRTQAGLKATAGCKTLARMAA
jgi:hypothetical protein